MRRFFALAILLCLSPAASAAITQAALTASSSGTDASSYDTASISPTANRLVIAVTFSRQTTANPPEPTLSGNGLTWVAIDSQLFQSNNNRISMFRTMGASPTSGAVTIAFGGQTQLTCGWSIYEFAGVDTTGTNGSGAVVQSAKGTAETGSSLTVTLSAFGSATNGATAGFAIRRTNGNVITPDTGWTEIDDFIPGDVSARMETQWRADQDTTAVASWSDSNPNAGIAIEIKEETAVAARRVFLVN